jgi:hypothetical protein
VSVQEVAILRDISTGPNPDHDLDIAAVRKNRKLILGHIGVPTDV